MRTPTARPSARGASWASAILREARVSDLAWQDVNSSDSQYGLVAIWLMNSSGAVSSITFPQTMSPGTWKLLGIGNFNGNNSGTADLAWQDQNSSDPQKGLVAMWFMSSSNPGVPTISCIDVAPFPTWSFLGIGNFDNNGTADLAWQDQVQGDPSYGLVSTWEMNTSGVMTGVSFVNTAPPSSWKLLAMAGFNQNGVSDMVWQDQNSSDSSYGLVAIWIMDSNGDGQSSTTTFPTAINPCNMQLTVGNAVGTNPPDLIWHNLATGQVLDWQVQSNGTAVQSSVLVASL